MAETLIPITFAIVNYSIVGAGLAPALCAFIPVHILYRPVSVFAFYQELSEGTHG